MNKEAEKALEEAEIRIAKEFLERYSRLNGKIDSDLRFKERMRALATRTTGDPFAPHGSGNGDGRACAQARLIDVEKYIDGEIDRLRDMQEEIWRVLGQMENQDIALILDDLYISGCSKQEAATHSGYSRRHIDRLVRQGLLDVARILRETDSRILSFRKHVSDCVSSGVRI